MRRSQSALVEISSLNKTEIDGKTWGPHKGAIEEEDTPSLSSTPFRRTFSERRNTPVSTCKAGYCKPVRYSNGQITVGRSQNCPGLESELSLTSKL